MTDTATLKTIQQMKSVSPTARTWRRFFTGPIGWISIATVVGIVLLGVFGPLLVAYPGSFGGAPALAPPSAEYWFGTDSLGRSVFDQVVWGTRTSLIVVLAAGTVATLLGAVIGIASAYSRHIDAFFAVIIDVMLALPVLPLMIVVTALLGSSLTTLVLVLGFFSWPEIARIIRSNALTVVHQPYVEGAKAIGASPIRIMWKEVLPMVSPLLIVNALLTGSRAVIGEAGLSFLGLGDPNTWSWGRVLYEAQRDAVIVVAWWQTLFPSLLILLLVLSATTIGVRYNDSRMQKFTGV
jgi:peptide/nickel transport system permease protein